MYITLYIIHPMTFRYKHLRSSILVLYIIFKEATGCQGQKTFPKMQILNTQQVWKSSCYVLYVTCKIDEIPIKSTCGAHTH